MSGLYASLNASVRALAAHGRAIEITGKNLSNVNNPGYARQRVIYGDRGTVVTASGTESLGFEAKSVEQVRDELLDRQVMREVALKAAFEQEQKGYQRAQAGLGQSIDRTTAAADSTSSDTGGLAAALDDFFNAFQSLASRPTDGGERQTLLQRAATLADRFKLTDQRLDQVQNDLDAGIEDDVADVNRLLGTIAELNSQIGRVEINNPGAAVDLRDQRLARLEELSAKLPVELRNEGSQIRVAARDADGNEVVLVSLATVASEVSFDGNQLVAGSATLAPASGSIKGALNARDGAIQTLRNDLDLLARQLVSSVNSAYNPTGATGDFFHVGSNSAGSMALQPGLSAATLKTSDGGAAADNTLALAVARLANQDFSTAGGDLIDGSFSEFYGKTVARLGQSLATANSRVEDQSNIETLIRTQRDSLSGVSLDEEMADLLKFQRAYQASSRVFSVMDELLETVVNRLGA